ncbi:hypothetical protein ACHQM5_022497 [Ranunculus cassubicifolius]
MTEKKNLSPDLPLKTKISLSLLVGVTDFVRRSNGSINRFLLNLVVPTTKAPSKTVNGVKVSDIIVDSTRNLWFRLFVPTEVHNADSKLPVLIFIHGGGFSFLSPDTREYDVLCRRLAREIPAIVVSINYRLSPEHRYPAPYDDVFDVLEFLDQKRFDEFPVNADLSRCFVAGDSAGGNIGHHVICRVAKAESVFTELNVLGFIAMQPYFGGEERTESEIRLNGAPIISFDRTDWHWKAFLPEGANRDHEAANVFGPNSTDISDLQNFPSTLLIIGGFDPLQDWQMRYYEGLKRSGKRVQLVKYPNAIHAFYVFPELPEFKLLLAEMTNFITCNGDIKQ